MNILYSARSEWEYKFSLYNFKVGGFENKDHALCESIHPHLIFRTEMAVVGMVPLVKWDENF